MYERWRADNPPKPGEEIDVLDDLEKFTDDFISNIPNRPETHIASDAPDDPSDPPVSDFFQEPIGDRADNSPKPETPSFDDVDNTPLAGGTTPSASDKSDSHSQSGGSAGRDDSKAYYPHGKEEGIYPEPDYEARTPNPGDYVIGSVSHTNPGKSVPETDWEANEWDSADTVSYTHLTLPTKA